MKKFIKIIFVLPFLFLLLGCSNNPEATQVQKLKDTPSLGVVSIRQNNIDLGEVPILGGKIETYFSFQNNGDNPVVLISGETSCMCTEGEVKSEKGVISSRIKMKGHGGTGEINQILDPGETATLIAIFNPLAHGPDATGPIKRDIFIKTNSVKTPLLTFSFFGNVIKGEGIKTPVVKEEQQQNISSFVFTEKSFDFGTIKQSGGIVKHDFEFIYKGTTPIEITGVPTSCACTSAQVSPTKLNPGDHGILTVKFNPNLHEEPVEKFFKTVSILTEPKLSEAPEVKIWTEIDLDLGEQAFELKAEYKDDHNETEKSDLESYNSITPQRLSEMLKKKNFILIDVHIPEQEHIEKTDLIIPYDKISENSEQLPTDKNAKIILYCRSGGMSRAATYELVERGYTNVFDLAGGKNAYDKFLSSYE